MHILRASSSSASFGHNLDGSVATESIAVAKGLLRGPLVPARGSSARHSKESSNNVEARVPRRTFSDRPTRKVLPSSNTWTSSSAECLEDHDIVDDRASYRQEYNRLAEKVDFDIATCSFDADEF